MVEDLIKRLRSQQAVDGRPHEVEKLTDEAADLIEQQAARLTALESERDALLAAAGKEAVGQAGAMPGTDGFTMTCFKASDVPIGTPLYTAPTAALENGDGRDAWISVDDRMPDEGQNVAFVVSGASLPFDHLNGKVLGGYFAHVARHPTFSVPGLGLRASHWQPLPALPAALSPKAGEQQ
jgi:hypothetical protein